MSSRSSLVLSFVLLLVVRKEFAGSWLAWPIAQPRRKWRERSAGQVDWFISSEHDMLDELQKGRAKSSSSSSSSSVRLLLLNFNDKKPRSIWNNRGVYLCVCVCVSAAGQTGRVCVCWWRPLSALNRLKDGSKNKFRHTQKVFHDVLINTVS